MCGQGVHASSVFSYTINVQDNKRGWQAKKPHDLSNERSGDIPVPDTTGVGKPPLLWWDKFG